MSHTNEEVTAFVECNNVPLIVGITWREYEAFSSLESSWFIGFLVLLICAAITSVGCFASQVNGNPVTPAAFLIGILISIALAVVAGLSLFFYNRYKRKHISRDDFIAHQSTDEISTAEYEWVAQVKTQDRLLEFSLRGLCAKKATLTKQDLTTIVFAYLDHRLIDEKATQHTEAQRAMQAHLEARKAVLGHTGDAE